MQGNRALRVIIGIIAVVFIAHQLYSSLYKPIVSETVGYSETEIGLNITGIIIRNETLVTSDTPGVLHFVAAEGSRVSKNGLIASIYDNENASIIVSEIDSINSQIAVIEDLQSYNDLAAADLDLINSKVNMTLNSLIFNSASGNFDSTTSNAEELLGVLNRRQMVTGVITDFSSQLEALKAKQATLTASLPAVKGSVYASKSGYFVSVTDGYENVLSPENLDAVTPEYLASANTQTVAGNVVGKIVSDYEWYIAAEVLINDSLQYKVGDVLEIKTAVKSMPILSVTVKAINMSADASKAVLVFSCNQMNGELACMRMGPMTVISDKYSGLKVNKSALRVIDSKTGVYIIKGMQLKFVPVNVLYTGETFIICEQQTSDEVVLRLYDDAVVKGKNLYDGKIIR